MIESPLFPVISERNRFGLRKTMRTKALLVFFLLTTVFSFAQRRQQQTPGQSPETPKSETKGENKPEAPKPESVWSGMRWRLIGPFRGGRSLAVEGVPSEPLTYYFGAAAGGVWKTTDGGLSWLPIFDKQDIASVGGIAVAPSAPGTIYVGTGEACWRGDISYGNGMYKSIDAGRTWQHIGLEDSQSIAKVRVHPTNPDIVFVAAMGHPFGTNAERGVFRSTDGGKTWQKVLYKDDKTGAIDLIFDPTNPNILYAALYQAQRLPWNFISGGPGSGLYKSVDGGATWKQIQGGGFPNGLLGRIGVAVSAAEPDRVYAIVEAQQGGIYRSDNGGESWRRVNPSTEYTQRAWYFHHIFADPKNADTVYVLNTGLYKSTDGGRSFSALRAPHGDNHALWIDPSNPARMINGNDGGATVTTDGGRSWTAQDTQPTAAIYHIASDDRFNYMVYGAQQDNSTVAIATRSDRGGITSADWYSVGGGESGFVVPYPPNPNVVYAGSYDGLITRYDKDASQSENITAWPDNPMGHGAAETKYRFQWTAPIAVSPQDPNVLYHGAQVVFRTADQGKTWAPISPDLTRNDRSKQQSSGGPLTQDNTSVEYFDTVFAIAPSPLQKGLIWAGTDDGLVQLTQDEGQHWANVTPKGFPEWAAVDLIEPSPHSAGTAFVAIDAHRLDDFKPYIFRTVDFGKTWTQINSGIPAGAYVHAVRQDTRNPHLLFAGTERGIYVSFDDGANWQSLQLNLPNVPVYDLLIKNSDLVIATHGRSFWSLDGIAALREYTQQLANSDLHVFKPDVQWRTRRGGGFGRAGAAFGANPQPGAVLDFYLKNPPKGESLLEILDGSGKFIRKISSAVPQRRRPQGVTQEFQSEEGGPPQAARLTVRQGFNRVSWNLRYESPATVPGIALWGGQGNGAIALPGNYTARLTVNGQTVSTPFELRLDPRIKTPPGDLQKQFELSTKIRNAIDQANTAANRIIDLRSQIDALRDRIAEANPQNKQIQTELESFDKKLDAVENLIVQPKSKAGEDPLNYPIKIANKLVLLQGTVDSADTAPTQASYTVFDMLNGELNDALKQWNQIASTDLPAINSALQKANINALYVGTGKAESQ
jgi:photosystem II stability/assembly factor-like uncharacterized protein